MTALTVLQLDTGFPRVPGDVGCAATYTGTVQVLRIPRATVAHVVTSNPDAIDIAPFEAAIALAQGEVIATSCGFLAPFQDRLAARTGRPVIASALGALDDLSLTHSPDQILIITFDASILGPAHLGRHAVFAQGIVGLPPDSHLRRVIVGDLTKLDTDRAGAEVVALVARHRRPAHRHILLECTNLPPYKAALRAATGLPVTDILSRIEAARPGTVVPAFV
ncbi:hypothetical protein SAMN05444004_11766 [Jannaschia faecimaris]|uniref:Aspartate/glutamate racemase family protein n=1 Tax=Jannaschia faecimaris TaxID=1244108 RepID=A0A1H3TIK2_9RHOB|nr:aspartate/glutamate racemase family protein [Jannaschia faecimaris]SDZ50074.1 hypothetical protein SAMN05444004_11766 [Jannaschia faecimaris]